MRILTIGNMYPPQQLGGAELVWQSWVDHARAQGDRVRVLTTDVRIPGATMTAETEHDVDRSLRWYWHDHAFPRLPVWRRLALERHNARVLQAALDEVTPDVVVWWAMAGMSFGLVERVRRLRLPAVAVLGDYWLQYGPDVDQWMRPFAGRERLGRLAERLTGLPTRVTLDSGLRCVFVSRTVRDRALEALPGLRESDVEVAHHGPDLELFAPVDRPAWCWRLLVLGRLDERKGVALVINTLPELPPEATLHVVGSGDDRHLAQLRALARDRQVADRVTFTPSRPRAELPALMAAADVLVFPVVWSEPWGLVPSEAMAVGLPVVGSGRGGSGEYLADKVNCLRFDPDDGPQALAERVRELATDPALRERLAAGGRQTAEALAADSFDARVQATVARAGAPAPAVSQ